MAKGESSMAITKKKPDADDLYEFGLDIPKRRVYLQGDIDTESAMQVIKGLSILVRLSESEPIQLVIDSEGGETIQGFAIMNYIRTLPNEVIGIVIGRCCSAAVIILQGCTKRNAMPDSVVMIHRGVRNDMFDKRLDERADKFIADRMGWTVQKLDKFQSYDRYLFAEEALEINLIDEILGK
jgi:ATP-dependent Clp protease protease subunit